MWTLSFFFLIVFFRLDVVVNWNLLKLKESSPPKNVLIVTPLLNSPEESKKAREEAEVKPFAGDVKSYAGYFTVHKEYHSNMYFWFFPSEKDADKVPVILWLHGGPAQSSMMGLFEENGPYKIFDGEAILRKTSWTKHYNVLYLDNPIGAGFSYTLNEDGYSRNIYEAVHFLYKALIQFYKMFPEYEKNAFYIVGQSYGGKYIPVLANWIHKKNYEPGNKKINLKGIMIGGGSLDPVNQIALGEYIYEHGLVDQANRNEMTNTDNRARCLLDSGYMYEAQWQMQYNYRKIVSAGYPTPLDVSDPHINMSCYNAVEAFVTREDVRNDIHAGDVRFYDRKIVLWYTNYELLGSVGRELSQTVQLGYKVLLYAGQYDMVTPPEQIDRVIASLHYNNSAQFQKAAVQPWYSHGELAGYKKSFANLQQVLVRKANHMIVRSKKKWMLDLLKSFAV